MTTCRARRGSAPLLVLCLYITMGSILLGAVAVAATARNAAERDYRRSQALGLAQAAVAEAQAGAAPHGWKKLGGGRYAWSREGGAVVARGAVFASSGAEITRTVRVTLAGAAIASWREGP